MTDPSCRAWREAIHAHDVDLAAELEVERAALRVALDVVEGLKRKLIEAGRSE